LINIHTNTIAYQVFPSELKKKRRRRGGGRRKQ